jgi:hypothetical protein
LMSFFIYLDRYEVPNGRLRFIFHFKEVFVFKFLKKLVLSEYKIWSW